MSVSDCIDSAVEGGEMDADRAARVKERLKEIERDLSRTLGPEEATQQAPKKLAQEIEFETLHKKRRSLMQASAQARAELEITDAANRLNRNLGEMAAERIEGLGNRQTRYIGAENHRRAVRATAMQQMTDVLNNFRRDIFGRTQNKATLNDMVRELFGEDSGNAAAKELAAAWQAASEYLRTQFNRAGGAIPKLESWGLPQLHDMVRVRKAGVDAWKAEVTPRLDRAKMIDPRTDQPFSDAELDRVLGEVYETITTEGWSKVKPGDRHGAKSIGARRTDHRFLHFKTADDWLGYQEKFGSGDAFNAMINHIDGTSRDIGAMRALGPNPVATVRHMSDMIRKDAAETAGVSDGGKGARFSQANKNYSADQIEALYGHYIGTLNNPSHESVAGGLATVRSFLTGVQLGSAMLSSSTDVATMQLTSAFNGIPMTGVLKRQLKLFNPANKADRLKAARAGLVAETWTTGSAAQMRFVGEVAPSEITNRMTDGILRVSGLSPWTDMNRQAFGLEAMGLLADNSTVKFNDLPEQMRLMLERYSITPDEWDTVRATEIWSDDSGATLLRPGDIRTRTDIDSDTAEDLATKVLDMIQTETNLAVPSSTIRGRAAVLGATRPGTIAGELSRSTIMYKSFPISMFLTHVRRIADAQGKWTPAKYAAALFISTAVMGAMNLQLKNIAKGRDAENADTPDFWLRAIAQGGGFGIFGDFLLSDTNRFGGSLGATVSGPVIGAVEDAHKLTFGNLRELADDEKETKFAKEVVDTAGRYTPGSSLWYARLAFQRLVLDQLRLMADPDANKRFQRQRRKMMKGHGQDFWWKPGQFTPERAPELTQ